ncbi:20345_t:CDS:2, partial [Racocetra persica]
MIVNETMAKECIFEKSVAFYKINFIMELNLAQGEPPLLKNKILKFEDKFELETSAQLENPMVVEELNLMLGKPLLKKKPLKFESEKEMTMSSFYPLIFFKKEIKLYKNEAGNKG